MKKLTAFLIALLMIMTMAACDQKGDETQDSDTEPAVTETTEDTAEEPEVEEEPEDEPIVAGRTPSGDAYEIAVCGDYSFEYPKGWNAKTGSSKVTVNNGADIPSFYIEKISDMPNAEDYIAGRKSKFADKYGARIAPIPADQLQELGGRSVAGFTARYSSEDGNQIIGYAEYAEVIHGDLYHYVCTYLSESYNDGESGDDSILFEFNHAIESLIVEE